MAEFKRLSDVNVIESMSAQTNVLVEENGEIVKLAANSMVPEGVVTREEMEEAIANSSGSGGVSSWNDLTDKPFYSEEVENPLVITQEMINNATESIDVEEGIQLKKVSNDVYHLEDLIGSTLIMRMEGEEYSEVITEDYVYDLSEMGMNGLQIGDGNIWSIFEDSELPLDTPIPITKGFWFLDGSGYGMEHEFYFPTHKIKKLSADLVEKQIKNLIDGVGYQSLRMIGAKEEYGDYEMGSNAFAEGRYTIASGNSSHAEGNSTKATNDFSHAEGDSTVASGCWSHTEGRLTNASGRGSHAEGDSTVASGDNSHAEGMNTIASNFCSHVEGRFNIEDVESKYAHIVGNGYSEEARSNAHTLDWYGNAWYQGTIEGTAIIVKSSTFGSTKRFKITVDDSGTISATEI